MFVLAMSCYKKPLAVLCCSDLESAGRERYCCENESNEVSVRGGSCGSQHSGSGECVFTKQRKSLKCAPGSI